jgi:methionyl-tRNA formyltransferase
MGDREEMSLRIEFLTQDDPLYVLPFFEEFFQHYGSEFEITGVRCSRAMGQRGRKRLAKELLMLYRPAGFVRVVARTIVSRILSKFTRTKHAKRFYGFQQLCRAYGVDYSRIGDPNLPEVLEGLRERRPDVIVSVACPYILKAKLLSVAKLASLNIHHAPLPRYRGMMPTFWQLYHGEQQVGVTVHSMSEKLDGGVAILRDHLSVEPGESLDRLISRSKRHGAHCMAKALRLLKDGTSLADVIVPEEGSYFTFPTRDEIREFHRKGLVAI